MKTLGESFDHWGILNEAYDSWIPLSDEQIAQEYEWEYGKVEPVFGDIFPTLDDFKEAVKSGQVKRWTEDLDNRTGNRSQVSSLEDLKDLVSGYQFPRDVDRIVKGFEENDPIPHPIVLQTGEDSYWVMSGNTRMDTAYILGITPEVLVLDIRGLEESNQLGEDKLDIGELPEHIQEYIFDHIGGGFRTKNPVPEIIEVLKPYRLKAPETLYRCLHYIDKEDAVQNWGELSEGDVFNYETGIVSYWSRSKEAAVLFCMNDEYNILMSSVISPEQTWLDSKNLKDNSEEISRSKQEQEVMVLSGDYKVKVEKIYDDLEGGAGFESGKGFPVESNQLDESIEQWSGQWVHFSNHPELTINPKQFHQDPAGYYLFPLEMEEHLEGGWRNYPYKFIVELDPSAKVLDLEKLSEKDQSDILDGLGIEPVKGESFWYSMRNHYFLKIGERSGAGGWNKDLRSLGYDAVFDDTETVHVAEIQLIILNPKMMKVVERVDQKGFGFNEVKEATDIMETTLSKYGDVVVDGPRKMRGMWDPEDKIRAKIKFKKEDLEIDWTISQEKRLEKDAFYNEISIRKEHSSRPIHWDTYTIDWLKKEKGWARLQDKIEEEMNRQLRESINESFDHWGIPSNQLD